MKSLLINKFINGIEKTKMENFKKIISSKRKNKIKNNSNNSKLFGVSYTIKNKAKIGNLMKKSLDKDNKSSEYSIYTQHIVRNQ